MNLGSLPGWVTCPVDICLLSGNYPSFMYEAGFYRCGMSYMVAREAFEEYVKSRAGDVDMTVRLSGGYIHSG